MIGINSTPVTYFVHAQQVVSILTGTSRRAATTAMHNFTHTGGSHMCTCGDFTTAYQNGATDAMI